VDIRDRFWWTVPLGTWVIGPCQPMICLSSQQVQQVDSQGPGILSENLFVNLCGSPAAGVTCGSDSLDMEGANLTRSAYCEYASM
jgi:hypothetical protein